MRRQVSLLGISLLVAIVLTGCDAPSDQKKLIHVDHWILDGLGRKDSTLPYYKHLLGLQIDANAEYFNGIEPEAMDISKVTSHAEAGDASAQTALFFRYYYGVGPQTAARLKVPQVEIDVCSASHWLHKAARGGWSTALFWMSELYRSGEIAQPDSEESLRWYLAWLNVVGLKSDDPPVTPSLFGLTKERFQNVVDTFPAWQAEESSRPLTALTSCPGVDRAAARGKSLRHP